MPFKPGESGNTKGRVAGSQNKLTKTVKERVLGVFNDLQEDPYANMLTWAKGDLTEFYKIAAKLIPTEVNAHVDNKTIIVKVPGEENDDSLAGVG